MRNYIEDRSYTDINHELAEMFIYAKYGIEIQKPANQEEKERAEHEDIFHGIDYIGYIVKSGKRFAIQERTRNSNYNKFNDITVRYERNNSYYEERKKSEFFKLKSFLQENDDVPFLMLYAVRGNDNPAISEDDKTFQKYAFIDLRKLYQHIENGEIIVDKMAGHTSYIQDGIMYAPIIENNDPSSTFAVFDLGQLIQKFPDVVLEQVGFKAPLCPIEPSNHKDQLASKIQGTITEKQKRYINVLLNKNRLIGNKKLIQNFSIREASVLIQTLIDFPNKVHERFPNLLVSPEISKKKKFEMDI